MPIYKMDGKKDGKQRYRVRVNYHDMLGNGKQIDRVVYGLEEAKFTELMLTKELKASGPERKISVQELHMEYLKAKAPEIRESTLDKHKKIIELHVLPELGRLKINALTAPVLQKWKHSIDDKGLALKTKQNAFSELRAILNYAVRMEYLLRNPLDRVGNFKNSTDQAEKIIGKRKLNYYTAAEFTSFLAVAKKEAQTKEQEGSVFEWNYYVFFALAFYTGLRKGEIHGLQWDDIEGNALTVRRSVAQKLKGGDRETPPKNQSSIRTLQIPAPLLSILAAHKKRWNTLAGFKEHRMLPRTP